MGYTTDFIGAFMLDRELSLEQADHLRKFADQRHEGIIHGSYYCQWVPTKDGKGIEWDGNEKFYDYSEWLQYIIDTFLVPWGYALSGEVRFQGEDADDRGLLYIKDGEARVAYDRIIPATATTYEPAKPD